MGAKAQLLAWCDAQVGHVGGEKYWREAYGWSGNGYPWCAVFCTDALKQTDTDCAYFPSTYAFDKDNLDVIGSAWVEPYSLQAGDMVSFSWKNNPYDGDHVGVIREVLGYGYYKTIEGNVSNSCGIRYRSVSDGIIGGIRPRYEEDEVTDNDIQKIAKAVIAAQIDYKNGADDSPHKASLGSRIGYIDYITHSIIKKLDEIIALLTPKKAQ